jgi:hypothetical protein
MAKKKKNYYFISFYVAVNNFLLAKVYTPVPIVENPIIPRYTVGATLLSQLSKLALIHRAENVLLNEYRSLVML